MKLYIRTNILTVFIGIVMLFTLVGESMGQKAINGSGLNIYAKVDSVGLDYVRIISDPGFAVNEIFEIASTSPPG